MLTPSARARFQAEDLELLEETLQQHPPESRSVLVGKFQQEGIDAVLEDPGFQPDLIWEREEILQVSLSFLAYMLVRQALAQKHLDSAEMADYVATVLVKFAQGQQAYQIDPWGELLSEYLVDVWEASQEGVPGASQHLGNFSLWLAGLFPDYITVRRRNKGAPGLEYFDQMGQVGFQAAARAQQARREGVAELLGEMGTHFQGVRQALNQVSDRFFFPDEQADSVERLLRRVEERIDPPER